jgi:DNA-binding transcriptional LysR family regulator
VALRLGRQLDSTLTARKIAECQAVVVGAPGYLDAVGRPRTPADLEAHQAIIYDQRQGGEVWTFRQGSAAVDVTVNGRLRVSAAEGVREAVFAGLGLSIGGSEWMFASELKSGAIEALLTDWCLPTVELWAVFPAGRQASAKARAFGTFMENHLASGDRLRGC